MAKEDLIIKVELQGSETAERKLASLDKAVGKDKSSGLTGAVFAANVAFGALQATIGLAGQAVSSATKFFNDSSRAASSFERSMVTLDIISGKFGVSGKEAQEAAAELGKELRIGLGASAAGLQNLLKSGLNLDQARDLLKRFTNEAITGKSENISLAQAVENLSFAYATNNSALGNLSGISENFEDIIRKGREALIAEGVAIADITDEMAKFKGITDLTNLTLGSAERFTGTLIDKQAQLEQQVTDLKVEIGQGLNPILARVIGFISETALPAVIALGRDGFEWFKGVLQDNKPVIDDINESIRDVIEYMKSPEGQEAIRQIGNRIKEIGSELIQNSLKTVRDVIKTTIDYFKSPEGQKGVRDFADALNAVARAANAVIGAIGPLYSKALALNSLLSRIFSNPLMQILFNPIGTVGKAFAGRFHDGGMIPGPRGAEVPIIAQAGEYVLPADVVQGIKNGSGTYQGPSSVDNSKINNINVNISNSSGMDTSQFGMQNMLSNFLTQY